MGTNVAANLQNLHETTEMENPITPLSWSSTLGEFHYVMTASMPLFVGMKYPTGMENPITLLVVSLVFYFGLMYFAKKLQANRDYKDFGAFINKISMLFGILALVLELLIIVLAYGSVPLFLWSICMVSVAVAVLVLLRLASVELREKLTLIIGPLIQYCARFCGSSAVADQEMINSDNAAQDRDSIAAADQEMINSGHAAQDPNRIKELPPV